jgi:hypothetical protein
MKRSPLAQAISEGLRPAPPAIVLYIEETGRSYNLSTGEEIPTEGPVNPIAYVRPGMLAALLPELTIGRVNVDVLKL